MSTSSVNLYVNFVLNAILGRLAEADTLMRFGGPYIRRVASFLAFRHSPDDRPIYRGVLVDPETPHRSDPHYTFVSWSEDLDVARWFATRESTISEPLAQHDSRLRGFVLTLPGPSRVLFHHTWAPLFEDLSALALQHPFMGAEGQRQIAWSLRTQQEVITEPLPLPVGRPIEDVGGPSLADLERKLTPPWVLAEERACAM